MALSRFKPVRLFASLGMAATAAWVVWQGVAAMVSVGATGAQAAPNAPAAAKAAGAQEKPIAADATMQQLDRSFETDTSDAYESIVGFHLSQFAYLAAKLDAMPEGDGSVLDNTKVPIITAGGMGGALKTGRTLDYSKAGDGNRKLCSLYLGLMDRWASRSITSPTPTRN